MKYAIFGLIAFLMISWINPADGKTVYQLIVDDHTYNLEYDIDADVIAMAIDHELNSLLIGIENTKDSLFQIILPIEMISAENNEFAILVDGFEVDYQITNMESSNIVSFFVPAGSQELEIIGTHVIPEFPLGVLIVFATIISLSVLISKRNFM